MHQQISDIKKLIKTDIRSARAGADQLLLATERDCSDQERAEVYHLNGLVHYYSDEAPEAISWYKKEIKLRRKLKDTKGVSDVLNNIGVIYYHSGKLDKAKEYYQKALRQREQIGDRRGIAGCYDNIGAAHLKSGMAAEALDMHVRALRINQEIGEAERAGVSLQNIGMVNLTQDDYDAALENFKESLDIAQTHGDKIRAIQLMINIGTALIKKKDVVEAKKYYQQCYTESRSVNYQHGIIHALYNLAAIEQNQGHYRQGIKHYLECIEIARATGYLAEVIHALSSIAESYSMLDDHRQALHYLRDALVMARRTSLREHICEIYLILSSVYERQGDMGRALEFYKKHIAARDTMVNKETTRTIHEIKTRYEVDKKAKEAEINRLKHIELKNALDELTSAKQQSDRLLLNILPAGVADELKGKGTVDAQYFEQAAVLFIDVKDFTRLSEHMSPQELVSIIDVYFILFDSIIDEYPIEKIKTIGDAYLCAAGLPVSDPESAYTAVKAALHIRDAITHFNECRRLEGKMCFEFRLGLHVGPLIAGVVGRKKFEYDIWGDTVNTAARMEQHSEPGRINISGETYERIRDRFECSYRGAIEAKNKGAMDMYFVEREIGE